MYKSTRISPVGEIAYLPALREAIRNGTEQTLAQAILVGGMLVSREPYHRKGKLYWRGVPSDAHLVWGEGEFNRFYLRALCLRAIEEGYDRTKLPVTLSGSHERHVFETTTVVIIGAGAASTRAVLAEPIAGLLLKTAAVLTITILVRHRRAQAAVACATDGGCGCEPSTKRQRATVLEPDADNDTTS